MSGNVQNYRWGTGHQSGANGDASTADDLYDDDWQALAQPGDTLSQVPEQYDTEGSLLWAALSTLNEDVTIDDEHPPVPSLTQGLATIKETIVQQLAHANHNYDAEQRFRADDNSASAYNKVAATFLSVIDAYTTQWGYGERAMYRTDVHQASDSVITKLLSILAEHFDRISFTVQAGEIVDPRYMQVARHVPTLDKRQVGTVERALTLGFTHHSGELARRAQVNDYQHADTI